MKKTRSFLFIFYVRHLRGSFFLASRPSRLDLENCNHSGLLRYARNDGGGYTENIDMNEGFKPGFKRLYIFLTLV